MSQLPSAGEISFTAINTALGRATRTQLALSDAEIRTLTNVASGAITFKNFWGKSKGFTFSNNCLIRRRFPLNSVTASTNQTNFDAAFSNLTSSELTFATSTALPSLDTFAMEYTGWITVPTSGNYTFGVTSDDGSDMAIYYNRTWAVVTSAYGYKGPESTPPNPGTRYLNDSSLYPVRIRFHEQGGGESLTLYWKTPTNSNFTQVPFTVFKCNAATPITTSTIRQNFPDPITGVYTGPSSYITDNDYYGSLSTTSRNGTIGLYDTTLMRNAYSGPVLRLRRANDNTEQDFYASTTGVLGTTLGGSGTLLSSWMSGTQAYVVTWFDQGPNGYNLTQTDTTKQPTFTTAKKIVFDGSNQYLEQSYSSALNPVQFTYIVGFTYYNTSTSHQTVISTMSSTGSNGYLLYNTSNNMLQHLNGNGTSFTTHTAVQPTSSNTRYNVSVQYDGTNITSVVNDAASVVSSSGFSANTSAPLRIGADANAGNFFNGDITQLYYFNVSIPSNDRTSLLTNIIPMGTLNISPTILTSAYSVRKIVSSYSGPVLRLRRTDGTVSDFYTDVSQTYLTTGANNTGTSFQTWVGNSTAYVTTWYDQSGNGLHATNTANNTTQPVIVSQSSKYVLNFINTNATELLLPAIRPNTIFTHFYNTNPSFGSIVCCGTNGTPPSILDYQQRFDGTNATSINGSSDNGDWYFKGTGTKLAYNNGMSSTTVLRNAWNVLSLSVQTPTWVNVFQTYFRKIGMDGYSSTRSINGYMTEMIFHNTTQIASDMTNYYNARLF